MLSFSVIPVMDLMGGKVVRALRGERHAYQPLQSRLCSSAEPLEVTQALLGLYPFKTLYIADLDAIQQRGNHLSTLIELRETYPDIEIWVDAGIKHPDEALALKNHGFCCVVASESLPNLSTAHAVLETLDSEHAITNVTCAMKREHSLDEEFVFQSEK